MLTKTEYVFALLVVLAVSTLSLGIASYRLASHAADTAQATCVARNAAIITSNRRWLLQKEAGQAAATARRDSAAHESGALRRNDLRAAAKYASVAASIRPYVSQDCG